MPGWAAAASAVIGAVSSRNASRRAANALESSEEAAARFARESTEEARNAAIPLYQQAQDNSLMGIQGALDVFGNTGPAQLNAFQQGNEQAQLALQYGQRQAQDAILGNTLNPYIQGSRGIDPIDPSIFQHQLPQFGRLTDALGGGPQIQGTSGDFGHNYGGGFSDSPGFMNQVNNPFYGGSPEPQGNNGWGGGGGGGYDSGGGLADFDFRRLTRRDPPHTVTIGEG